MLSRHQGLFLPQKGASIKTICLVGCSKSKLAHAAPAQDLYCSALFRLSREWAKRHSDAWAILSARYGMIEPDRVIEPYNTTIADHQPFGGPRLTPPEFAFWLYSHVQAWCCRYASSHQAPRLITLAGRAYWHCLVEHGLEVSAPLDGLAIGERLRWLKQQLAMCSEPNRKRPKQPPLFDADSAT